LTGRTGGGLVRCAGQFVEFGFETLHEAQQSGAIGGKAHSLMGDVAGTIKLISQVLPDDGAVLIVRKALKPQFKAGRDRHKSHAIQMALVQSLETVHQAAQVATQDAALTANQRPARAIGL
jgi:hypothetical protein